MIPKLIHYCWFGNGKKPKLVKKCINSWKKYCPDYKIIEWNENNFNLKDAPKFVQDAFENKKWAFVTDYARLKIVYDNGGIYFDTDVELLKNIDSYLKYNSFFGRQTDLNVATGLGFGAIKGAEILKELMEDYESLTFSIDSLNDFACPKLNSHVFTKYGLVNENKNQTLTNGTKIFSTEYLCPVSAVDLDYKGVTENSISIHHFMSSWSKHWSNAHKKFKKRILKSDYNYIKKEQGLIIAILWRIKKFFEVKL